MPTIGSLLSLGWQPLGGPKNATGAIEDANAKSMQRICKECKECNCRNGEKRRLQFAAAGYWWPTREPTRPTRPTCAALESQCKPERRTCFAGRVLMTFRIYLFNETLTAIFNLLPRARIKNRFGPRNEELQSRSWANPKFIRRHKHIKHKRFFGQTEVLCGCLLAKPKVTSVQVASNGARRRRSQRRC